MNLKYWKLIKILIIIFVICILFDVLIRNEVFMYFSFTQLTLFTEISDVQNQLNELLQITIMFFVMLITIIPLAMGLIITYYSGDIKKYIWNFSRFKFIACFNFVLIFLLFLFLFVMNFIKVDNQILNSIIIICFLFSVLLLLVIIFFYIFSVVKKIDSSYLIKEISKKIIIKNVPIAEDNPIDLFFTLMEDLYNNKDYVLFQQSLSKFGEKVLELTGNAGDSDLTFFVNKLFYRIMRSYNYFLNENNDAFIFYTINTITEISEEILNKGNDEAGEKIIGTFKSIADTALKKKNEKVIAKLNFSLEELGKISIQRNLCNTLKENMLTYREIWEKTKKLKLDDLSDSVIGYISYLAEHSIKKQNSNSIKIINSQLEKIAIHSIKNDYEKDLNKIISIYENLLHKAIEEDITWMIH